jgi:hypothetical protein
VFPFVLLSRRGKIIASHSKKTENLGIKIVRQIELVLSFYHSLPVIQCCPSALQKRGSTIALPAGEATACKKANVLPATHWLGQWTEPLLRGNLKHGKNKRLEG